MKIYFIEWKTDYEKLMISLLQAEKTHEIYPLKIKHFKHFNLKLKRYGINNKWFIKLNQLIRFSHIKSDDIMIFQGFSAPNFTDLIDKINCKKVLIIRDTINVLQNNLNNSEFNIGHPSSYIDIIAPHFDLIYSFDPIDCLDYHLLYLEQFVPFTFNEMKKIRLNAINLVSDKMCFFVGAYREEREKIIDKLILTLSDSGYTADIYLVHLNKKNDQTAPVLLNKYHDVPLNYTENIKKSMEADVILEINYQGQAGLSLRAVEALILNKKLITTNRNIQYHELYRPEQIFILDDNYKLIHNFLLTPFAPVSIDKLYKYSSDGMLNNVLLKIENIQ